MRSDTANPTSVTLGLYAKLSLVLAINIVKIYTYSLFDSYLKSANRPKFLPYYYATIALLLRAI